LVAKCNIDSSTLSSVRPEPVEGRNHLCHCEIRRPQPNRGNLYKLIPTINLTPPCHSERSEESPPNFREKPALLPFPSFLNYDYRSVE
jgi:hypothetical protein